MAKKKVKGKKAKRVLKKSLRSKKPKAVKSRAAKKMHKKAAKKPIKRPKVAAKKSAKVKKVAMRSAKASAKPAKKAVVLPPKNKVGEVTHFYSHISVAVLKLEGTLKEGDKISIEGATTNFKQTANSMQMNHETLLEARPGDEIGLKVKDKVREGDVVYKI